MTRLIDRLMFWRKQEPGPYRHPNDVWPDLYAMFGRIDDSLEFVPEHELTPGDLIGRICRLHQERDQIDAQISRAKRQLDIHAKLDPES
jgi:hypothetical protein